MTGYQLGAAQFLVPPVLVALAIGAVCFRASPGDGNRVFVTMQIAFLAFAGSLVSADPGGIDSPL